EGLDDLVAHLAGWSVARAAAESGLAEAAVRDLARRIAGAERCTIAWAMGVNHSVQGTHTVTLINTVCLLTGHIGRPGSAPFSITGQCNAMGTRETGFTASMPGYRAYDDPAHRAELAALSRIDESRLPARRGPARPGPRRPAPPARAGRAVAHRRVPAAGGPGPGLPRHRERGDGGPHQGAVDHRHPPPGFVPQPRCARARAAPTRPAGRAGRVRDPDHGPGRRGPARRDLGREGRHVHQQRAPCVAGA